MSSSFDTMARVFLLHFECKDEYLKHLFHMALEALHSANHEMQDAVNRDSQVMKAARQLDNYAREIERKEVENAKM